MYKIGNNVEYLNSVWEVCDSEIDSVEIYNEKMGVNIYVPINDVKPYQSAHDKLIALGWVEDDRKEFTIYSKNSNEIYINKQRKTYQLYSYQYITNGPMYVSLELSRILTQYLEEME